MRVKDKTNHVVKVFLPGVALFEQPASPLREATSHFPRTKHHPRNPVTLHGLCHQTGVVLAPTQNPYVVINQPCHLLFVFL